MHWSANPRSWGDQLLDALTVEFAFAQEFGIHLSQETMELVSAIQEFRQRTIQPTTLASIVEDAIGIYDDRLEAVGSLYGTK